MSGHKPSHPDPDTITLYDSYHTPVVAGQYKIVVNQTVTMGGKTQQPTAQVQQNVTVTAPEFAMDPGLVLSVYPPVGGSGVYGRCLPSITLVDSTLPWVRLAQPGGMQGAICPWLALFVFAEGELPLVPNTGSPVSTTTVAQLVAPDPNVVKPVFPGNWFTPEMLASQCQTITIPGTVFETIAASSNDLPYLAHCQVITTSGVSTPSSVVLANRFPLPGASQSVKYYAHLVSVEGLVNYITSPTNSIGPKASNPNQLKDVQVVSLYNWTFRSQPELDGSFKSQVKGLIKSESGAQGKLQLTVSTFKHPSDASNAATARLNHGYVPLKYVTGPETTFCWYRGPLTPVKAQALPDTYGVPTIVARTADQLSIYSPQEGLFDVSYSTAWSVGRSVALADANFSAALNKYRVAAMNGLVALTQRMSQLNGNEDISAKAMVEPNFRRDQFKRQMANGLGQQWTTALSRSTSRTPTTEEALRLRRTPSRASRASTSVRTTTDSILSNSSYVAAIAAAARSLAEPVSAWITRLAQLTPVPFSHLAPDPRMLPVESIRFFYVDNNWVDALIAGALSVAIHTGLDATLLAKLIPSLTANLPRPVCGLLIRSQMLVDYPGMTVRASSGGTAIEPLGYDERSSNVRLYLYPALPDTVTLAEAYQGLNFGAEDNGIALRNVSDPSAYGQILGSVFPSSGGFSTLLKNYSRASSDGVLNVAQLAKDLASALSVSVSTFGTGDFGLQFIQTPESQRFQIAVE